jgi:hypothetical protein
MTLAEWAGVIALGLMMLGFVGPLLVSDDPRDD